MVNVKFGTDGARGPWNPAADIEQGEINLDTARQIGAACAELMPGRWVVAQDTREFNPELVEALKSGLASRGAVNFDIGIMPTPAAALIASEQTKRTGIIHNALSASASHNPAEDAGIKVFGAGGKKLDDESTKRLEARANNLSQSRVNYPDTPTDSYVKETLRNSYINMILSSVHPDLRSSQFLHGETIVVDAANGAAHWTAPEIMSRLGARVILINGDLSRPINERSGAEHPESMIAAVETHDASYGMSLDGDADRLTAYIRGRKGVAGRILDGDDAIALAVQGMIAGGKAGKDITAVVTTYTSLGFEKYIKSLGVGLIEVDNGDRYILEAFNKSSPDTKRLYYGHAIGGEQAGHTLYPIVASNMDRVLSGDGVLTALQELQTSAICGKSLLSLSSWDKLAYIKDSVKLPKGVNAENILRMPQVAEAISKNIQRLGNNGRLHIRGSGTQPIVRILTKATERAEADEVHAEIAQVIMKASE